MTDKVRDKLLNAWSLGCTDREAALFAGVPLEKLEEVLKNDEDIIRQRDLIRETPAMKARMNVVKRINSGDVKTSKWYLERTSEEFSNKVRTENTTNATISINDKEKFFEKLANEVVGDTK